jgi:hypothetical protein
MWNSSKKFSCRLRAMRSRFSSSNLIEYLRELESICKTVLSHESGDPGVLLNEKIRGPKISSDCPFKPFLLIDQCCGTAFFSGKNFDEAPAIYYVYCMYIILQLSTSN